MSDELKPCPRCGGAIKVDSPPDGGAMGAVGYWCEGCGDGNYCWDGPYQSREEAVAAANRRTPGPKTAAMLEWCKTAVDWFDHYPGMSAKGRPEDHVNMATFRAFIAEHEPTAKGS